MGRPPCCDKIGIKKGPWTPEEDIILVSYIQEHGPGNWRSVPINTGLMRCSKSCRLRWTNYLRPGIKRGNFTPHEEDIIIHLQSLLGNRWAAIASYLPQRTDNDIKNYWNTHLKKKLKKHQAMDTLFASSSSSESMNNPTRCHDYPREATKPHITKIAPRSPFANPVDTECSSSSYASSMDNISKLMHGFMKISPDDADIKRIAEGKSGHGTFSRVADKEEADPLLSFNCMTGGEPVFATALQQPALIGRDEEGRREAPLYVIEKWLLDDAVEHVDLIELSDGCCSVPVLF